MKFKNHLLVYILVSGFLFTIDQFLKYFARTNPDWTYYLWHPWLGWEYFTNTGIAFSLPFPNGLVIILTPLIILGLIIWMIKLVRNKKSISYLLSLIIILAGALSNYIDRIFFNATIDYLRVLTGIINLADVMIAGGVVMLIFGNKKIENFKLCLPK